MHGPTEPDKFPGEGYAAAGEGSGASAACCGTTGDLVYDLSLNSENSDEFYRKLTRFSDHVLVAIQRRTGSSINEFISYVRGELREAERSRGEYELDLLILGLLLGRYLGAAETTPGWVMALARELYWHRRESPWSKPVVDLGRAILNRFFLAPKIGRKVEARPYSIDRLTRLIDWLQATGEFEQEVRRLNNWRSYLRTLPVEDGRRWMTDAVELFGWFEREAAEALGAYTSGVAVFLATEHAHRGIREDQIFCGRQPVEYHLAMVATEIMNRGLRERFEQMPRKAVLVPECMRVKSAASCRARVAGVDIVCAGCDLACPINRITQEMRKVGATVYLIPHATGFSRWLERWQREPNTGVVAVACLMNILPGGYEMRARRIASQCVPLEFPGCSQHWRRERQPTRLNETRLVQIVSPTPPDVD